MPQAKNRELLSISSQAHEHLMNYVAAMNNSGRPTSGTKVASELLLSLRIPIPQPIEKKPRRARRVGAMSATAAA